MKKIIIIEYFTSKAVIQSKDNKILGEAIKLTNSLIKVFALNEKIKKVLVVRNSNIEEYENIKTKYFKTRNNKSFLKILKLLPEYPVLVIAPETRNISVNFQKKISKYLPVLHSSLSVNKIFSSKLKTIKHLNKYGIKNTGLLKKTKFKNRVMVKSNYGTGSEDVKLLKKFKITRSKIIQNFYPGIKCSFMMICYKRKNFVISCNKQITEIYKNRFVQTGVIVGGLENERENIQNIANKITNSIEGLFGIIGVDIVRFKGEWHVIEVNPRFTSAFIGLYDSIGKDMMKIITDFYLFRKFKIRKLELVNKVRVYF